MVPGSLRADLRQRLESAGGEVDGGFGSLTGGRLVRPSVRQDQRPAQSNVFTKWFGACIVLKPA